MQISPSPLVASLVRHYLFIDTEQHSASSLRLFPDGHPGIVFCMYGRLENDQGSIPHNFLYGQPINFSSLYSKNRLRLIIVVLWPHVIPLISLCPADNLTGTLLPAGDIPGGFTFLSEQLQYAGKPSRQAIILNTFFQHLLKSIPAADNRVIAALKFIRNEQGNTDERALSAYMGYTPRHLRRFFRNDVGLSPKRMMELYRLHHYLRLLRVENSAKRLTTFALEAGYFDQAHLNHTFKHYTGISPRQYVARHRSNETLAVNLLRE
jgi:AraC-like DNA-binding protein